MKYQKINIVILSLAIIGLIFFFFFIDSGESSLINIIFCSTSIFLIVVYLFFLLTKIELSSFLRKLLFMIKILVFILFLSTGFLIIREYFMQDQRDNETKNALMNSGYYK